LPNKNKIIAICDTREQTPLDLEQHGIEVVREKLDFGDYSLKYPNMRNYLSIERKTLQDFVACCGKERDRFMREIQALKGFRYKAILCEFRLEELHSGRWRSMISSRCVSRTIARLMVNDIPFIHCDNSESASRHLSDLLHVISKDVYSFAKQAVEI
jgi:DNA excision repair protein ERCC-4